MMTSDLPELSGPARRRVERALAAALVAHVVSGVAARVAYVAGADGWLCSLGFLIAFVLATGYATRAVAREHGLSFAATLALGMRSGFGVKRRRESRDPD